MLMPVQAHRAVEGLACPLRAVSLVDRTRNHLAATTAQEDRNRLLPTDGLSGALPAAPSLGFVPCYPYQAPGLRLRLACFPYHHFSDPPDEHHVRHLCHLHEEHRFSRYASTLSRLEQPVLGASEARCFYLRTSLGAAATDPVAVPTAQKAPGSTPDVG